MIDTLKFEIDRRHFDYKELHDLMYNKFEYVCIRKYKHGDSINFKYKNWLFFLTKNKFVATGSLNKLFHGNNLVPISFKEVKNGLDSLYEVLKFDISDAKIKQIDIGHNLVMNQDVNSYLDLIVAPVGFKPWKLSNETLYLKKNDNVSEIVFYNKFKEAKSKNKTLMFNNENILRYELKLKKNIKEILGDNSLVSLYNVDTYSKLIKAWYESYVSIPKITQPVSSKIQLASKKSLTDWLIKEGIKANGGIEVIFNAVTNSKLDKNIRYKIRKLLKSIDDLEYLNPQLKEELDYRIEAVYLHQQAA
ncbi:hypothetical protein [Pedobacter borealis]|uniref:hypothetical protein n=1 Tax=Pedobacter borealis TaxID=475254 RepID=UPI000493A116|nr:hypothetical protein [Pedobacter borealis]